MSRSLLSLFLAFAFALPSGAFAAEGDPPATARLAVAVAEAIRAAPAEAPVAVSLSGSSAELRRAFGTLLASRLAAQQLGPVVLEVPPERAEATAREQGARSLVRLTLDVEGGELVARGDVLGTWVNFWSGRTPTRPPKPAAAVAEGVEADAAVLALASVGAPANGTPGPGPQQKRPVRLLGAVFARVETPLAALTSGDLDGDGRDEVAALTAREVFVFAADGRLLARRELEGAPATATTREPFGALAVLAGPPRLAAWSTRYAKGELLVLDKAKGTLRSAGTLDAAPLGGMERGTFVPGQTVFAPEVRLADGRGLTVPAPFGAASFASPRMLLVHADGTASLYARPASAPSKLSGLGVGSALGDLDGDGVPELITTSPLLQPTPDAVRVLSLTPDAPMAHEPLWQGGLPPGRALFVVTADLDGDKRREVVVGSWKPDGTSELFLLRQGAP
ncbi:VCBS repeat-containing protein [Corallococcus praedator]|uniref:VCBS repeat-containing protein n=1 Tax=Corallococcus praedator TaxID=2316724 RepID=A0ABX9Q7X3_9BACT|nr:MULTISPECIES: VCBS repeat-containing protein [Corallococcus]RKH21717.1 VCBS repeat-containing protein [Corallococcus sp. CA031C]RKH94233.1 VCBS repeat-containing protein [Corallococcus praedator]